MRSVYLSPGPSYAPAAMVMKATTAQTGMMSTYCRKKKKEKKRNNEHVLQNNECVRVSSWEGTGARVSRV